MANSIQIAGANFTKAMTSITLPDRRDVVGEYIFGSAGSGLTNLANASAPLSTIGTPTVYAHSALVSNNTTGSNGNGYATGITPYYDHTLVTIRKASTGSDLMLIAGAAATDGTGTFFGLSQVVGNTWTLAGQTMAQYTQGAGRLTDPLSGFFFEVVVFQQGKQTTLYWYSGGTQQSAVSAGTHNLSAAPYQIGANPWGTAQSCEVAYTAFINRPMQASEIDNVKQSLTAYYAALNVTVA